MVTTSSDHTLYRLKQEIYKKLNLHCLHVRPWIYSEYKFGFTSCDYSIKTSSFILHSLPLTNAVWIFCLVHEHLYCLEGIAHNNSSMWSAEGCSHSTSLRYTHTHFYTCPDSMRVGLKFFCTCPGTNTTCKSSQFYASSSSSPSSSSGSSSSSPRSSSSSSSSSTSPLSSPSKRL